MKISANFDSGNIHVISADSSKNIQLSINKDNHSDFYQWFHFRVEGDAEIEQVITINDLKTSAYPEGWTGYEAVASYDREDWFRVPTEFDGDKLVIKHTPEVRSVYYAYFAPYSYDRHLNLIHQAQASYDCSLETLGHTLDGRDMSLLTIGEDDGQRKKVWITARQHPGETMAEWFVEGLLDRLLDEDDTVARALLEKAVFYVVPNMNPDGSVRGHLRTNAAGMNLNREWQNPSMEKSPEVYLVREQMLSKGLDMFLDIHGDEALPYNFVAGCEGVPSYNDKMHQQEEAFKTALLAITPEFQDEYGYPKDKAGEANLTVGSAWVGEQFTCLAYTIEMPFKDNADHPDPVFGWSPDRSQKFGSDTLVAIHAVIDQL